MIEQILAQYGAKEITPNGNSFRSTCPIHNGSNPSSFVVNSDGVYYCHACHASGNLITLVSTLEICSPKEAVAIIKALGAEQYLSVQTNTLKEFEQFDDDVPEEINLDLSKFLKHSSYFEKQGFHKHTLEHFNVRYCDKSTKESLGVEFKNRCIIPIYDKDSRLVAISARASWSAKRMKYRIWPKLFPKRNILYNLNHVVPGSVLVCEGFKEIWRLWEAGIDGVALMGCSASPKQIDLLLSNFTKVTLVLDCDIHGLNGMIKMSENLSPFVEVKFLELPLGKDLSDLSVSGIHKLEELSVELLSSRKTLFKNEKTNHI